MARIQRYVSDRLTHFVGRGKTQEEQYQLLLKVIRGGKLMHPPFDDSRCGNTLIKPLSALSTNDMVVPECVCFCDIPLEDLPIHMGKYSRFGIAFSKDFVASNGGNPVFYVACGSTVPRGAGYRAPWFDQAVGIWDERILPVINNLRNDVLTPEDRNAFMRFLYRDVFGHMKFFNHALPDHARENYYMEREWRVVGHLPFSLDDILTVIFPRDCARRFRTDCPNYVGEVVFAPEL
jgi:hypothetical protein